MFDAYRRWRDDLELRRALETRSMRRAKPTVYVQFHTGDPNIDEALSGPATRRVPVTMDWNAGTPANEKWVAWALWDGAAPRRWWQFWKRRKPIATGFVNDDEDAS